MVYFKKTVLCVMIFFAFACQQEKKRPEHILGHPEMASIMAQMMIAQNKVYHEGISGDSLDIFFYSFHKKRILERKGISNEQFEESYLYYEGEVERFDELWQVVVDSISLRKERGQL